VQFCLSGQISRDMYLRSPETESEPITPAFEGHNTPIVDDTNTIKRTRDGASKD
jgi:hypothetical protein